MPANASFFERSYPKSFTYAWNVRLSIISAVLLIPSFMYLNALTISTMLSAFTSSTSLRISLTALPLFDHTSPSLTNLSLTTFTTSPSLTSLKYVLRESSLLFSSIAATNSLTTTSLMPANASFFERSYPKSFTYTWKVRLRTIFAVLLIPLLIASLNSSIISAMSFAVKSNTSDTMSFIAVPLFDHTSPSFFKPSMKICANSPTEVASK